MLKNLQKFLIAIVTFLLFTSAAQGQAMTVGGLAFTGYNRDQSMVNGSPADNDFSFVLLQALGANQPIFFTDFGWRSDAAAFQVNNPGAPCTPGSSGAAADGVIRWQHTAALPRGTHIRIRCAITLTATIGTVTPIQINNNGQYLQLGVSASGEQIFAFTGSVPAPTLIAGIDISDAWEAMLTNCDFTSSATTLPAALSTNNYAFQLSPELGKDNGRLKQTVKLSNPANLSTDRATIANVANWDFSDATAFTLPGNLFILPVNFSYVKAAEKGGQVQVDFGVGTEQDITEYVVERSADGRLYASIGSIPASRRSSYSFADIKPLAGTNFYRIRAVELNGSGRFSTVANINLSKGAKGIGVYPGIVRNNQFTLQITNLPAGSYKINIHSAVGQLILSRTINHAGGSSTQTVNLPASTQKGVYRVRLTGDAENAVTTIVIE
jgi:hypothetical protein